MIQDNFAEIVEGLKRMLQNDLGEKEVERLKERLGEKKFYDLILHFGNEKYIEDKLKEYATYSAAHAYKCFKKKIGGKNFKKWIYWSGVAAACFVVLVGWLWHMENEQVQNEIARARTDMSLLVPGGQKAQLKLANGTMVEVVGDSMAIQENSGAQIQYADGKLSYRSQENVRQLIYNELIVPMAGECYLVLDDGTQVWMNSDSKLKYPVKFLGTEREVFLEGEAYFKVARGNSPFIVNTCRGNIRVLGTTFDIKAYRDEEEMLTTLVSGKVQFINSSGIIELLPGEQAVVMNGGCVEKRQVEVEEYIGWREGVYVFREQRLETIMTDLARWYNVSVFYQHPEIKEVRFTGNLRRYETINTFMEILSRTGDVKYNINGNTIILYQ